MIRRFDGFDLTGLNTFGMKVSCRCFVQYDSTADLRDLDFASLPQPVMHLGAGSNILFTGDFPGTVLHSGIKDFHIEGSDEDEVLVEVGSGVIFDDFCSWAADNGYWGPENLSGIPGEVGASAVQNIGAYGVEVCEIISRVRCYDTETHDDVVFTPSQCEYAYRDSIFKHAPAKGRYIVTAVLFRLTKTAAPRLSYGHLAEAVGEGELTPLRLREAVLRTRDGKLPDPAVTGSAGSYFKNPVVSQELFQHICGVASAEKMGEVPHFPAGEGLVKVPAAWMIDKCGLKGLARGGAAVYDRQPLVIVNASGEASPQDVLDVEKAVRDAVQERFGVSLSPEVEHV